MPSGVTVFAHQFGDGDFFEREFFVNLGRQKLPGFPVARNVIGDVQACRVAPCKQGRAGGGAVRMSRITLGETHTLCSQTIQVGRLMESAAETAEVRPAKVIGEDDDDVGAFGCSRSDLDCDQAVKKNVTEGCIHGKTSMGSGTGWPVACTIGIGEL